MAQQFPKTAQAIYDAIAADITIMEKLGTYTFREADGSVPAISIVSPGEDLPALRNVQGIEVVCHDIGDTLPINYLTEAADTRTDFPVFVITWVPKKGGDALEVVNLLLRKFGGSRSYETVAVADGLGALVQTKLMIRSDMPIL